MFSIPESKRAKIMISVSIVNVTSYTGLELLRLLAQHPHFILTSVTARSAVGKRLDEVFPQLIGRPNVGDKEHISLDPGLVITEEPARTDLAFVCLPPAAAARSVVSLLEQGTRVVDLSADFRLRDAALYEEWYKHVHPAPALLETAVYGLCERYRERIEGATLVANPGCFATAAILGLAPALAAGIIAPDVIIDAKSGVSGAGRSPTPGTHYAEYYANEPFIHVVDQPPHTKWTYASNACFIYPMVDTRTRRLLVISCLDNLVKGAAGQAIQNANRLYGLPETSGLPAVAVFP